MSDEDATAREVADPEGSDDGAAVDEDGAAGAEDGDDLVARVAAADEALAGEVADLAERADDAVAERAELRAALDDREAELEEVTERLQRTQADFQNYKKRAKKRQEQAERRATEDLLTRLLEVRDNLDRALADDSGDAEALREGVELTMEEFDRVLDREGVAEITPEPGDDVDPQRHEVMMRVDSDVPEGTVADCYRPGFEMDDKVLRPAQVTVSDGPADGGDGGET